MAGYDLEYQMYKLGTIVGCAQNYLQLLRQTMERRLAPDAVVDGLVDSIEIELLLMLKTIKVVQGE